MDGARGTVPDKAAESNPIGDGVDSGCVVSCVGSDSKNNSGLTMRSGQPWATSCRERPYAAQAGIGNEQDEPRKGKDAGGRERSKDDNYAIEHHETSEGPEAP